MAEIGPRPTETTAHLTPHTVQCAKCKKHKPKAAFGLDARNKEGLRSWCKACCRKMNQEWRQKNPFRYVAASTRASAKKRGLEYALTPEYLETIYRELCPVLGIPLYWDQLGSSGKRTDNTPSLDRIDNAKGYLPGNVVFISCGPTT